MSEINCNGIFYLNEYNVSMTLSFQHAVNMKFVSEIFYILFFKLSL